MNATEPKTPESCETIRPLSNDDLNQVTGGIIIVSGRPALTEYRPSYLTSSLSYTAPKIGG
jgi:bacteriocin-like protein